MVTVLAALPALFRHWRVALIGAALLIAGYSHAGRLKAERALERCRAQSAIDRLRLEQAGAAARALARDSRRRAEAQARGLKAAQRANASEQGRILELRRSSATVRRGEGCGLSDALKQAEGEL